MSTEESVRKDAQDEVRVRFVSVEAEKKELEDLTIRVAQKRAELDALYAGVFMYGFAPQPVVTPAPDATADMKRLSETEAALELIACQRTSAQDTLAQLAKRKIVLVRLPD
jgi:hypothetical protein